MKLRPNDAVEFGGSRKEECTFKETADETEDIDETSPANDAVRKSKKG